MSLVDIEWQPSSDSFPVPQIGSLSDIGPDLSIETKSPTWFGDSFFLSDPYTQKAKNETAQQDDADYVAEIMNALGQGIGSVKDAFLAASPESKAAIDVLPFINYGIVAKADSNVTNTVKYEGLNKVGEYFDTAKTAMTKAIEQAKGLFNVAYSGPSGKQMVNAIAEPLSKAGLSPVVILWIIAAIGLYLWSRNSR